MDGKTLQRIQERTTPQNSSIIPSTLGEPKNDVANRLSYNKVLSYASIVWQEHPIMAELISTQTSQIIQIVDKRRRIFFSGKSEKRLLSGIFYFLGLKNRVVKTQRQIAAGLGTSDVTVRISYRDWLANFPNLLHSATKPSNKNHCRD